MEPTATINGLAVYKIGTGEPVFVVPYPHAATFCSISENVITEIVLKTGHSVITFDPPGAYRSTRNAQVDMQEMINCVNETLDYFHIKKPIDIVGHSMGSFCALAYALQNQEKIKRLVLIGSTSGWKAQKRFGIHKSWTWKDREYWLTRFLGTKIYLGLNNFKTYTTLNNIVMKASFFDKKYIRLFPTANNDNKKELPIRGKWLENVRNYEYRERLHEITIPVLICAGKYDRLTPLVMNKELQNRIANSKLVVFTMSGHFPFVEESDLFLSVLNNFLNNKLVDETKIPCSCRKRKCKRYGNCKLCVEYHSSRDISPYCERKLKNCGI